MRAVHTSVGVAEQLVFSNTILRIRCDSVYNCTMALASLSILMTLLKLCAIVNFKEGRVYETIHIFFLG